MKHTHVTTLRCRPVGTYLLYITDTEFATVLNVAADVTHLCDCALMFEMANLIEALRWYEKFGNYRL